MFTFVKYELFQSCVLDFNTLLFEDRIDFRLQVCFFQNGVLLHNKNLKPDETLTEVKLVNTVCCRKTFALPYFKTVI